MLRVRCMLSIVFIIFSTACCGVSTVQVNAAELGSLLEYVLLFKCMLPLSSCQVVIDYCTRIGGSTGKEGACI